MTRGPLSVVNALALTTTCGYCSAPPGAWCWTRKGRRPGRRSTFLHADRTWMLREAWYLGVREGYVWAAEQAAGALDRTNQYSDVVRGRLTGLDPGSVDRIRGHFVGQHDSAAAWLTRAREQLGESLDCTIA